MKRVAHFIGTTAGCAAAAYLVLLLYTPWLALNPGMSRLLLGAAAIASVGLNWGIRQPTWCSRRWLRGLASVMVPVGGISFLLVAHQLLRPTSYKKIRGIVDEIHSVTNEVAPELEFVDLITGRVCKLSELKGKTVLVNFWATWCRPCVAEMPDLSRLQQRYEGRGFILLMLSAENAATLQTFFTQRNIQGLHGKLASAASVPALYRFGKAFPTSYLIDKEGLVRASYPSTVPLDLVTAEIEATF